MPRGDSGAHCESNFRPSSFADNTPIGKYVVDFACPRRKLAIELDGGHHALQCDADKLRSTELAERGYRVIRFWNNEVLKDLDGVLERIRSTLENPPPHPDPLRPHGAERGKA